MFLLRTKPPTKFRPLWRRTVAVNSRSIARGIFIPELATSFPYRWLRDSCQCSDCVHPSTLQKLYRSSDVPNGSYPASAELTGHDLRIAWSTDPPHKSIYPFEWLKSYSSEENNKAFHTDVPESTWDCEKLRHSPHLFVDYAKLREETSQTLLHALVQLIRYGVIFVRGVPNEVTDDQNCELRRLASTFGRIRDTFYGEVWNVKNIKNSTNIAYTNLDLGFHMDLMYYQHPPRYQILHCLRNRVQGGTSAFLDAFHAAQTLYKQSASAFDILSRTPVPYHYINDGHHLHHSHPVISLSKFHDRTIEYINYSPPFQAPLPIDTDDEFYDALKQFAALLDVEKDRYEHTLREGEAVIFDNRRVLHARSEFHEKTHTGDGETLRWLKGCYLEADDVLDLHRRLNMRATAAPSAFRNTLSNRIKRII